MGSGPTSYPQSCMKTKPLNKGLYTVLEKLNIAECECRECDYIRRHKTAFQFSIAIGHEAAAAGWGSLAIEDRINLKSKSYHEVGEE